MNRRDWELYVLDLEAELESGNLPDDETAQARKFLDDIPKDFHTEPRVTDGKVEITDKLSHWIDKKTGEPAGIDHRGRPVAPWNTTWKWVDAALVQGDDYV